MTGVQGSDGVGSISANGITIGYDDTGSGAPLVLVHGHPFNRSMWRPQVERFAGSGWRVITPDLRGYGQSTVVPGRTTMETFARDVAALLDALGVGGAVLGGLSIGGQVVMEFFRLFPGRVRGLLLADTSPLAETEAGRKDRNDTADRLLRIGMAAYADELLPKMVAPATVRALPTVAHHVREMMRATPAEGAAAALRGRAERPDYVDVLRLVAVPALVVVGREDEYTSVDDTRRMYAFIPDATLKIVDGAGHLPNLEQSTEFNAALQQLLDTAAVRP